MGLALRFALSAPPCGLQSSAPGNANDKIKNQRQNPKTEPKMKTKKTSIRDKNQKQKGDTSNEIREGTFLKRLDTRTINFLTDSPRLRSQSRAEAVRCPMGGESTLSWRE